MCRFDCLISFQIWTLKKRFNAQNWILTSAELKIQWLLNGLQFYMNTFITNHSLVNHFLLIYTIK